MPSKIFSRIRGSGSYIPSRNIPNEYFRDHTFYDAEGRRLQSNNAEIIRKFEQITGIQERRYVRDDLVASDIAFYAATKALADSQIDEETLDYIIVAHNFGDVRAGTHITDMVPALASRVKHHLGIKNPLTIPYDLPFGCPGFLQGMIQADYFIRSGDASRALIIGAETLSRVSDPHDRDSMIYADGAGAVILESIRSGLPAGILSHYSESYTRSEAFALQMGQSNRPGHSQNDLFLKMQGRKVYELALKIVPLVIGKSLDKAGVTLDEVDKILIHQANHKMDEAIVRQLYKLYSERQPPEKIMPMTISWLGNTSVATLPTLYDLLVNGHIDTHEIRPGNVLVFVSVGAGMNVNSVVYRVPA